MVDSTEGIPDVRSKIQAEANFNWRIAPLPHTTPNSTTNVLATGVSIPRTTPKEEIAAWLFLKFLTSPEIQAKLTRTTNSLPVRAGTVEHLGDYFASSPATQMTLEFLSQSTHEPSVPGYTQIQSLTREALRNIVEGEEVSATLSRLSADANELLEEQMALIPESPDLWAAVDPSGQTITFWHPHSETRAALLDEIINEFNATNRWGITVLSQRQAGYGEIFQNYLASINTDQAPNLVIAYQFQAGAFQVAGNLADLTSLVESTKWGFSPQEIERFFPSILEQDKFPVFDGARLGIPFQRSTDVLYFNEDWLAELGYGGPPTNPDEFKQMACAAAQPYSKSEGESSTGYCFYLDATRFSSWVFAFGGAVFGEETSQFLYNGDTSFSVVSFLMDLLESGCALPIRDREEAHSAFSEGRLLFMVDSSFHISSLEELVQNRVGFKWQVAAIPGYGDTAQQNVFGASVTMTKSSPEEELAAWLVLKYLTSPEIQAQWGRGAGYLPVRRDSADFLSGYFSEFPNYLRAFELLGDTSAEPSLPGYDFVRQEVALALEAIFNGMEITETLDALNSSANQILATRLER
jgi:multiple sugar transport system substrate-binding protein/sn-glycerol 3-phosphate transport system substrate-binding protein